MHVEQEQMRTELVAVITAVVDGEPMVLTADGGARLPSGPLQSDHDSMQTGLRAWVEQQTSHRLGYVEQLYTFADPGRASTGEQRVLSVSYLGLTQDVAPGQEWVRWYDFFGWEDLRESGAPARTLGSQVGEWAEAMPLREAERQTLRANVTFGIGGRPWRPQLALQRYELLYEANLLPESPRVDTPIGSPGPGYQRVQPLAPGRAMADDHRRILATALARLRAKIEYRPVVFEFMPAEFTLSQLQTVVEALAGTVLHKQNFRRLVQQQNLVEPVGSKAVATGGRPAQLFRFRPEVIDERHIAGTKLPVPRAK